MIELRGRSWRFGERSDWLRRRLASLLASLAAASILLFLVVRLLPGDPANALLSAESTPEQIAAARRLVGSEVPLQQQFFHWLRQLGTLDFGESFISGLDVRAEIASRLAITVPLTLGGFVLALFVAVPVGYLAAARARSWLGVVIGNLSQFGIAIPVFWVGILLTFVFALRLGWLPAGGFPLDGWSDRREAVRSLLLPVVTIAIVMSASLTRYIRSATLDVIGSDFIRTARAQGASYGCAMWQHGLRNAAAPVISILGIEIATTIIGAVVVEQVFALPGLGSLLVRAIAQHDYQVIQGILFVSTLMVLCSGFVADLIQRLVDPRLAVTRTGHER